MKRLKNGATKEYWKNLYDEPESMDGIFNAKEHARYLKAFFDLEGEEIRSLVDLGCGFGHVLKEMVTVFRVKKFLGVEPSEEAFQKLKKKFPKHLLIHQDLKTWLLSSEKVFDLGICMSVFQYISYKDLKIIVPLLSSRFKYLYLSVPTKEEYIFQVQDEKYIDPYAYHRSRQWYLKLLAPHFTVVGSRLLESRKLMSEQESFFSDFLYRF